MLKGFVTLPLLVIVAVGAWDRCPYEVVLPREFTVECTTVTVPLDYSKPAHSTDNSLEVFVNRFRRTAATKISRHVYWLRGGPGGSGEEYLDEFPYLQIDSLLDDRTAFIMPDFRGTGLTAPWNCSIDPETVMPCSMEIFRRLGERANHFTLTASARDVDEVIRNLTVPEVGKNFHVFGDSFGTLWVQRYLHVRTVDPASVTLDGTYPADGLFDNRDSPRNIVGLHWLHECSMDVECSAAADREDPTQRLIDLFNRVKGGQPTCLDKLPDFPLPRLSNLRKLMNRFTSGPSIPLMPALLFRLTRCSQVDVKALTFLLQESSLANLGDYDGCSVAQSGAVRPVCRSGTAHLHTVFSEMFTPVRGSLAMQDLWVEQSKDLYFSGGFVEDQLSMYVAAYKQWPLYDTDEFYLKLPSLGAVPLMMLTGSGDPNTNRAGTTHAWVEYTRQNPKSKVRMVDLKGASHVTYINAKTLSGDDCGMSVIGSFVNDPQKDPDTSCISQLKTANVDWMGHRQETRRLSAKHFGTPDLYQQ